MAKLRIFESGNPSNYIEINHLKKSKIKVYWTDLKNNKITNAVLGDLVRFHIEKTGIKREVFDVKVYEENFFLDEKIDELEVEINKNKGYFEFRLQNDWEKKLKKTGEGNELEFYCKICNIKKEKYLKVTKKEVINWTPKVDSDGKTYYICKDIDRYDNYNNINSFMLQYGDVNNIRYGDVFNLVKKNEKGELCVSGELLKNSIGTDILKINNSTFTPTDQQMFDHFLFAIDKSRSLGEEGFRPSDYFSKYKISDGFSGISTFSWRNIKFHVAGKSYNLYVADVSTWTDNVIRNEPYQSTTSRLYSDGKNTTHLKFEKIINKGGENCLGEPVSITVDTETINFLEQRINKIVKPQKKRVYLEQQRKIISKKILNNETYN